METLDRLAEKLRAVDFDRARLTDAQNVEVFTLARAAGVELPHPNESWASTSAGDIGGLACVAATDQEKSCNRRRLGGLCLTQRARHSDHGPA